MVTCEEHSIIGGLGCAVSSVLSQNYPVPLKMVGVEDKFGKSAKPHELLELYGLTTQNIINKAKESISLKKNIF